MEALTALLHIYKSRSQQAIQPLDRRTRIPRQSASRPGSHITELVARLSLSTDRIQVGARMSAPFLAMSRWP